MPVDGYYSLEARTILSIQEAMQCKIGCMVEKAHFTFGGQQSVISDGGRRSRIKKAESKKTTAW